MDWIVREGHKEPDTTEQLSLSAHFHAYIASLLSLSPTPPSYSPKLSRNPKLSSPRYLAASH